MSDTDTVQCLPSSIPGLYAEIKRLQGELARAREGERFAMAQLSIFQAWITAARSALEAVRASQRHDTTSDCSKCGLNTCMEGTRLFNHAEKLVDKMLADTAVAKARGEAG